VAGGAFSDVSEGLFEGQRVALKVMRLYDMAPDVALKV
jgi:hypothetical protein